MNKVFRLSLWQLLLFGVAFLVVGDHFDLLERWSATRKFGGG